MSEDQRWGGGVALNHELIPVLYERGKVMFSPSFVSSVSKVSTTRSHASPCPVRMHRVS